MSSFHPSRLFDLSKRIALVTGGGTGIGAMIAKGLAASGAKVYITGRRLEVVKKLENEWRKEDGGEIVALQMDVTDKKGIASTRDLIEKKEGKLHILVNNAGQSGPKTDVTQEHDPMKIGKTLFDNENFEDWSSLYSINVSAQFFVTTAFLGLLAKGSEDHQDYWSSVINTTSVCGITRLSQNHFCYNSSKAAAAHLTKLIGMEIAKKNIPIRVNAIAPGVFPSEMTSPDAQGDAVNAILKPMQPVPAGRPGGAEEMAGTAIYLASRAGGYTNGQEIVVDGGYLVMNP